MTRSKRRRRGHQLRALAFVAAVAALAIACATACASAGASDARSSELPAPARAPVVGLVVVNHLFADATIYVLHDGVAIDRLGVAKGLASTTFVLRGSAAGLGSTVAFLARPLAGDESLRSGAIGVEPGLTLVWTLGPGPRAEYLGAELAR